MGTRRTFLILAAVAFAAACLYSCTGNNPYKGFDKTENGAYMKFHKHGTGDNAPQIGDMVSFTLVQTFQGESKLVADEDSPIEIAMEEHTFVGDIFDALSVMHPGDSVTLTFYADSIYKNTPELENLPEYKNTPIYYDMKLLEIIPAEQMEAEYRLWVDELKKAEQNYLEKVIADNKAAVAGSGLVILSHKQLKNKPISTGEYALFDIVLCNNANDTLMDKRDFVMQCGSQEICKGIDEALLMMRKGETMKCIIPSSLAFDSIGGGETILPYEPLHLDLRLVDIFSEEEYNKYEEEQEKMRQAEYEKRMAEQTKLIEKYLKNNSINAEPTESGLYLKLTKFGKGEMVRPGQRVAVHYVLYNLEGKDVESSYSYGQPLEFDVGMGQMIPGIDEAVLMMNVGSKAHLVMTSDLAFDNVEIDPVLLPANSPVAIDLELVSVK